MPELMEDNDDDEDRRRLTSLTNECSDNSKMQKQMQSTAKKTCHQGKT